MKAEITWIACTDKLPENHTPVLIFSAVTADDLDEAMAVDLVPFLRSVIFALYMSEQFILPTIEAATGKSYYSYFTPTHWAELPEGPF